MTIVSKNNRWNILIIKNAYIMNRDHDRNFSCSFPRLMLCQYYSIREGRDKCLRVLEVQSLRLRCLALLSVPSSVVFFLYFYS